jgi:hypothetical protein
MLKDSRRQLTICVGPIGDQTYENLHYHYNAALIVAFLGGFSLTIGLDLRLHELLGVRGDQSRHWCVCRVRVACCAPSGQERHKSAKWVVEAVYTATMFIHVYPR